MPAPPPAVPPAEDDAEARSRSRNRRSSRRRTAATTTTATTTTTGDAAAREAAQESEADKPPKVKHVRRGFHPTHQPLRATPPLGLPAYDFPVFGAASWGDTYGADRSDVPGGWHHGDDLFAKLGTPVVAVADGTVFAVGWNRVGGWRLWLRDDSGTRSTTRTSPATRRSRGTTTTFGRGRCSASSATPATRTRPSRTCISRCTRTALLYLGYDGAVDPTTYLAGWHRARPGARCCPPVVLPSHAPAGQGSLTDYRRLLALRARSPRADAAAEARGQAEDPGRRRAQASRAAAVPAAAPAAGAAAGRGGSAAAARRRRGRADRLERPQSLTKADLPSSSAASEPTRTEDERGQMNPIPNTLTEDVENGRVPLGRLLVEAGLLTDAQVDDALFEGGQTGERLGEIAVRRGMLSEEDLARTLAEQWSLSYVDRASIFFDAGALARLSREDAQRLEAMPTRVQDGRVVVAVAEPTEQRLQALREVIGEDTVDGRRAARRARRSALERAADEPHSARRARSAGPSAAEAQGEGEARAEARAGAGVRSA